MKHEMLRQKIPNLRFQPEGYLSSGSEEYFDELMVMLKEAGFDTARLVYSGFDGTDIARGAPLPRHPYIFAMDETGWRKAVKYHESNPAQYAEGWETPCLGLYDRDQLAQAYAYGIKLENVNDRIELSDIEIGAKLQQEPLGPVDEAVVHKDYPDASPSDALVGLVYLD